MVRKLTIKRIVNNDPAIRRKSDKVRYEVSDGWNFPTRKMAQAHIKRYKKYSK